MRSPYFFLCLSFTVGGFHHLDSDAVASVMEDRSQQVLAATLIFITLAWIAVGLRVYVRAFMLRTFALDDWLIVLSLVCLAASDTLDSVNIVRDFILHTRFVVFAALHMALASICMI